MTKRSTAQGTKTITGSTSVPLLDRQMVTIPKERYDRLMRVADISIRDYQALTSGDNTHVATASEWKSAIESLADMS
jgi:hypothetical protein